MGKEFGENVTDEFELVRKRRLRNAENNREERRKDEAYKKHTGRERPKPEPEGKLLVDLFKGKAKDL